MAAGAGEVRNAVIRPSFERVDSRGTLLEVLNAGRWGCVLYGEMKAGAVMGNHYHRRTEIFIFLARGRAEVTSVRLDAGDRAQQTLGAREGVILEPNVAHAIRFTADSSFIMLKSLAYDTADPDTFHYRVLETG